ncbi:TauD/TfdA family dioxygenase [Pleionea sp. CnH1-48]|uniref:TauD/TfdA family dioxygenase n=1 Tax=Pleionea sp. CnH1-48 TaxID=2954494 RepID=UPI002096EC37|nr:TauD/TfdA family dioxygenase [Pleionea sp. CnH1-48]MCO7223785.1 TauD/TfdA family dioxygenase [Pleionea sp. CnH1-48]
MMAQISKPELNGFIEVVESRSDDPEKVAIQIKQALKKNKVVKLTLGFHVENLREFYNVITDRLGRAQDIAEDYAAGGAQTGERWMEIRYDADVPDMSAYRHSKNAQPLHTDESYIAEPCDVMVFYCKNKAARGGETLFVDGVELVERMKVVDPELLSELSETSVIFEKAGNKRIEKIIDLENPLQPVFNYNYYCISPNESDANKSLNRRFFEFLETHVKGSYLEHAVGLRPGESVYWWDHFVVHGRNPFEAYDTNDRFIWKTGVIWND